MLRWLSMKTTKSSHTITILKALLAGEALSSNDLFISNANQYFCDIKNTDIELIEIWKQNVTDNGRHKVRKICLNAENIQKTKSYLNHLMGVKSKKNEKSAGSY